MSGISGKLKTGTLSGGGSVGVVAGRTAGRHTSKRRKRRGGGR